MRAFIGGLSYNTTNKDLQSFLAAVTKKPVDPSAVSIILDRETGRSKGFGFVEVDLTVAELRHAIGSNKLHDRYLTVDVAKPKPERSNRTGGPGDHVKRERRAGGGDGNGV